MSPSEENPKYKPIPNPYITGNPVRGKDVFFGREDDFAYVRQRLLAEKDGIVMLFVGARRSGKTSIMVQILDGRLGDEFLPVFVDMQRFSGDTGDRNFFSRLAEIVIQEGIKDERLALEYYDFSEGNPVIPFDRLLEDIQRLHPERRMIFLVDEAEILQSKVDQGDLSPNVLTYMASILESRKISFCFTGSPGLGETQGSEWRRLSGKGEAREISFLSREDTIRLAQLPVEGHLHYADGVFEEIYNLTYGQPFYTQVICTNVVDYLNGAMRNRLEKEDLEEVVRTIVDNPPPQLIYEWDNLNPQEMITISLLSEESQGPGMGITAEELAEAIRENDYPLTMKADAIHIALESLYNSKWLERDEEGAYHIRVDLFRQWIRRARSIWRLVEDQEPKSKKKLWGVLAAGGLVVVAAVMALWATRASEIEEIQRQQVATASAGYQLGKLYVQSEPVEEGVEVWINGQLKESSTPARIDSLDPKKTYTLELRHEKYLPWEKEVRAGAGDTEIIDAKLERKKGIMKVSSNPPDAGLVVKGEKDTSGVDFSGGISLPTGEYEVTVKKAGYIEQTRRVTITNADTVPVSLELVARVGCLYVNSRPSGAGISIDGKDTGVKTPNLIPNLPTGKRRLGVILQDHISLEISVTIALGETLFVEKTLELLPGALFLESEPPGVEIFLDGKGNPAGQTPLELDLAPGKYRVIGKLMGFDLEEFDISLAPGQNLTHKLVMEKQFGWVRVILGTVFGTVLISGEEHKVPPGDIRLQAGVYQIAQKGKEGIKEIEVTKGDTASVRLP
jgi:hypothetical protein